MDSPPARSLRLAFVVAVTLVFLAPLARADSYGFRSDFGMEFDGPNWEDYDNPYNADGTLRHAGPPGSGDTAGIAGTTGEVVTCSGGAVNVLNLIDGANLDVTGSLSVNTFNNTDGVISGGGTLTAGTVDYAHVQGGNLVATTASDDAEADGGSINVTSFGGKHVIARDGGKITVGNALTDVQVSVQGGGSATLPGLSNGQDVGLFVHDAGSMVDIASDVSLTLATVDVENGATLKVGGQMLLDAGKDVDGDDIGGGGGFIGAGTFASVAGNFIIGVTAPTPGFSLAMNGGATVSANLVQIARDNGSYGIVTMSDTGTVWNVSQGLVVGSAGTGELDMGTGAQLQFGAGAQFFVGASAGSHGTLQADGTGTIIDARQASTGLGNATGAQGNVTLDNGASLLLGQDTFIGVNGGGGLYVNGGSQASIGTDTGKRSIKFGVGDSAGGTGNVSIQGAGSQFYMGDYVRTIIGVQGNGFFGVGTGGTVRTSALALAADIAATGQIVIDGSGSTWTNTDTTQIGGSAKTPGGTGSITLTNGAQMRAASNPRAECYISATGQIVLDATSQFAVGGGAYGPGGSLRVSGLLSGKGKQVGSAVYNTNVTGNVIVGAGGKFQPGGDPDVFSIKGDCDLNDAGAGGGETDFEIGGAGTAGTDYDQLVVSGTATLGGTLRLVFLPGYKPKVGDAFTFVQAGTVAGGFAQVIAPGLTLNPAPAGGKLTVTVTGVTAMTPPTVTSVLTATAPIGTAFSYQITATNTPSGYAATGLPDGLTLDPGTGLITGTPTTAGTYSVVLSATNTGGTGMATLVLTVGDATPPTPVAPVITSAASAAGVVGVAFNYQITASNAPTSFAASGLPGGLSVDPVGGLISGTPTAAGTFTVGLAATNAIGTATATLGLTITAATATPPVVTVVAAGGGSVVEGAKGKVFFQRTGNTGAALVVHYKVKGSAQAGIDYKALPGTVTIPAGAARVKIKLKTFADGIVDGVRVAKVKLAPSTDGSYTPGSPATAKLKIIDGD